MKTSKEEREGLRVQCEYAAEDALFIKLLRSKLRALLDDLDEVDLLAQEREERWIGVVGALIDQLKKQKEPIIYTKLNGVRTYLPLLEESLGIKEKP